MVRQTAAAKLLVAPLLLSVIRRRVECPRLDLKEVNLVSREVVTFFSPVARRAAWGSTIARSTFVSGSPESAARGNARPSKSLVSSHHGCRSNFGALRVNPRKENGQAILCRSGCDAEWSRAADDGLSSRTARRANLFQYRIRPRKPALRDCRKIDHANRSAHESPV
jgi:hypothetical protein